MTVYTYSMQGKRPSNEDAHINYINMNGETSIDSTKLNLLGVFDGHGGKAVSNYLKKYLPLAIINNFNKEKISSKFFCNIYNNIQKKMEVTFPRLIKRCGSTACICIHFMHNNKNKLCVVNVGDSRAIICNKFNIAVPLTIDHKPGQIMERKRIEYLGGTIEYDGSDWRIENLSLSRAFGDCDAKPYVTHEPEVFSIDISSKDKFIIVACDGVWDVLSNQEAIDFVINLLSDKSYTGNYAKDLSIYAYNKGSSDNITIIIYMLQ